MKTTTIQSKGITVIIPSLSSNEIEKEIARYGLSHLSSRRQALKSKILLSFITAYDFSVAQGYVCVWGSNTKTAQIISAKHNFHCRIKNFR